MGALEDERWFLASKATADVLIAAVLLVVTLPLILVLIALVKLTSPGPSIFQQVRLGRGGRPYQLYKIRTMKHDCELLTGPQWAKASDPRVTAVGRFLRRSHLDELPQLWNVVRGEMSLVGPRPERPEFVATLEQVIPLYRERLSVNPGITGLAQIQLPPDATVDDVRRKVACDLCYIQQMSPVLDVKILLGTAFKVMGSPYHWTRRALDLPGTESSVEPDGRTVEAEAEPLGQLQSV